MRFVQQDKSENVVPSIPFGHFKHFFFVIPSVARNPYNDSTRSTRMRRMAHGLTVAVLAKESRAWMLRFAQHDKKGEMRFVQQDKTDCVIPLTFFCHSERSEESSMDASLRSA